MDGMDWSARLDDKGYHKTSIRRPDTMAVWDCDVRTAADMAGWRAMRSRRSGAAAGENHGLTQSLAKGAVRTFELNGKEL